MRTNKKAAPSHPQVSYRLDGNYYARLEKLARTYELSPGQMTRRLVEEALDDAERIRLRERMSVLERQLTELQEGLADATEALLLGAGKVTEEEASEWVETRLRRK